MTPHEIRELILRELPAIIETDPEVRDLILRLASERFADKAETESRFDRLLDELRRDREEQSRKWDEQTRKWEEQNRKWEEQNRKWDENQKTINALIAKIDSSIGALGARWGIYTEQAFREGLTRILSGLGMTDHNIVELDEEGEVFGRPDQVELDVVLENGELILCEIKSSMSRADVYSFDRKVRFYESRHGRKATRRLVISPMVDDRAKAVAERLGIEVCSHAEDAAT